MKSRASQISKCVFYSSVHCNVRICPRGKFWFAGRHVSLSRQGRPTAWGTLS